MQGNLQSYIYKITCPARQQLQSKRVGRVKGK
uniref:Uncharacterized protein n=1 Tax=Anguilla anguilla TaxID=7936 RepID=A0A0E9TIT9_ANGAN